MQYSEASFTSSQQYFQQVVSAYAEFREFSPVVACNYDPAQRSKKLNPTIINFLADVDLANKRALRTPELIQKWETLVSGQQIEPGVAASIVSRCARMYRARSLAPHIYFRIIKKPIARGAAAA